MSEKLKSSQLYRVHDALLLKNEGRKERMRVTRPGMVTVKY